MKEREAVRERREGECESEGRWREVKGKCSFGERCDEYMCEIRERDK